VTIFFITYCIFSFPSSRLIEKRGLRAAVVVGAWLQAIGTVLRCLNMQVRFGSFIVLGEDVFE
jgi:fucose permease